jgi:hypothetical protein
MICGMCPIICKTATVLAIQINALSSLHAFALSASLTLTPCWRVAFDRAFVLDTFTQLLCAQATAARVSPTITIVLLEAGIVDTLYQISTGVLPSSCSESDEQGNAPSGQGLGGLTNDGDAGSCALA